MTIELVESLPKKLEIKSAGLPLLDLLNIQTLAEDIAAEPGGREVKRFAGQIIEDCDSPEMADVRALGEQIRQASLPDERAELAARIVAAIEIMLEAVELSEIPAA